MLGHTGSHCGRTPALVVTSKVVKHVVQADRVDLILNLLAVRVRQSRESSHRYSHGQILAFNEAGGDMVTIAIIANRLSPCADATWRRVARFMFTNAAIEVDQHRIVNFAAGRAFDRFSMRAMTVAG